MADYSFNSGAAKAYSDKAAAAAAETEARQYKSSVHDPGVAELIELLYRYTGQGSLINQTELFFSRFDRYGINTLPGNVEHSGLTFFTRPKLPLTRGNLQQVPSLIGLDVNNPVSFAYAIRCWLDTKFTKNGANFANVDKCPFFNRKSAFNIPLSNACIAQSGWPDPFIQTFTTTGGFFQEDQTFPIGSDRLRKTYDLNFTFKETQGGPILAMLYAWYEVMASLTEGSMVAYAEDIDAQRMCYTVSIYRFLLDPSKRHITHYAKATGCFPKAPPMGALFNQSPGEEAIEAAKEISIPFVANKIEYDDPRILLDFNMLVTRYCPDIHTYPILRPETYNNFKGLPFVISTQNGLELAFREPLAAAYEDEVITKKMLATTRERFELSDKFYPGVPKEELNRMPRGDESRYLYRVTRDPDGTANSADIKYYFDTNDEYGKHVELPSNTAKDPDISWEDGYRGPVLNAPLKDIEFGPEIFGYLGGLDGKTPVRSFDPVFVNMPNAQSGTIDSAAVKRALSRYGGSNRDDVDQGGNVIKMRDVTKEQKEQRIKSIKDNKASDPLPVAERLPINPDNFSSSQRAADVPSPESLKAASASPEKKGGTTSN